MVHNKVGTKFYAHEITGFQVFSESAKYTIKLLELWDCFTQKTIQKDVYVEKYKHLKIITHLYYNILEGKYVNFA